jgi:hypothetical protein
MRAKTDDERSNCPSPVRDRVFFLYRQFGHRSAGERGRV